MTSAERKRSSTVAALAAAGNRKAAEDVHSIEAAAAAADAKAAPRHRGLVERLIYGPLPEVGELRAGGEICAKLESQRHPVLRSALEKLLKGAAFSADGKLSQELRDAVAKAGGYGLTIPRTYGGSGESYLQLAGIEEALAANGLGAMAVELSGQLTIGAGSLLGYGSDDQKRTYLPLVAEGTLTGFALTEVGTGVNAKKIGAYVERDSDGNYRLFAAGTRNKLWITNARHGGLVAIVARIGEAGRDLGLFIVRLPDADVALDEHGWAFRCAPSGVDAFSANYNSRLHFENFPIAAGSRIPGDGVEVLFYSLRLGRCMLAAMSAGYQRMLAGDAARYAQQRQGVGGLVITHELPQLAIGRMLGGSLQARALAFLALSQDEARIDLAGLRDITKSAAAQTALESMVACEHVMGGRAFDGRSRVNAARANLHLFGVVEGEDDLIRLGMVRDVTARFAEAYLAPLLAPLSAVNRTADAQPLPVGDRVLRLAPAALLRRPRAAFSLIGRLILLRAPYCLLGWMGLQLIKDLLSLPERLLPAVLNARYRELPRQLRPHAQFAERQLKRIRWTYLRLSITLQLELTTAQIAVQRLGQRIEWLMSLLALCHHAACQDSSQWNVAALQCELLRERLRANKLALRHASLTRTRKAVAAITRDVQDGEASLLADIEPEPWAHPFSE